MKKITSKLYGAYYIGHRCKPYLIPSTVRYLKRDAKTALREEFTKEDGTLIISEEDLVKNHVVLPITVEARR